MARLSDIVNAARPQFLDPTKEIRHAIVGVLAEWIVSCHMREGGDSLDEKINIACEEVVLVTNGANTLGRIIIEKFDRATVSDIGHA